MKSRTLKSDLIMLVAAFIWGSTFVAQRIGMSYIKPFLFNAVRFLIGALFIFPLVIKDRRLFSRSLKGGIILGLILFIAIGFQQWGLVYTTASKAGFITGLYVVFVPVLGIFMGKRSHLGHVIGALLALFGLYLLSIRRGLYMEIGDLLVFMGAIAWTFHVQLIDTYVDETSPFSLAFIQFSVTALLSFIVALFSEGIDVKALSLSIYPLLYAGILSSGIAYTLQVVAQKEAHPSHAAIILSLESVFAAISGFIVLGERFTLRELTGALLMIAGMIVSQVFSSFEGKTKVKNFA